MMYSDLRKLTGKLIKWWYHWLHTEGDGCCSVCFDSTEKYNYVVCMGWHHYDDEMVLDKNGNPVRGENGIKYRPVWKIAWKIGRQTRNNIMQSDFDVDFEMPYVTEAVAEADPELCEGDVDSTLEVVECAVLTNCRRGLPYSAPSGYPGWDALASHMRKQARRVFNSWKDHDE
jgi:hypothetical protein